MKEFYITLWISIVAAIIVLCAYLFTQRRNIVSPSGLLGLVYLLAFTVSPMGWLLSLSWPLNDPAEPEILGVGGFYGTQYELNRTAVYIWTTLGILCCILVMLGARKALVYTKNRETGMLRNLSVRQGRRSSFDRLGLAYLITVILLFTLYYTTVGWETLWFDRRFRFEENYSSMLISVRALSILLLMSGMLGAFPIAIRMYKTGFMITFLCVMPFITTASRGAPLIIAAATLGYIFSVNSIKWRFIVGLLGTFCVLLTYVSVLTYRNSSILGIQPFIITLFGIVFNPINSSRESVVILLQNLTNGFPIFAEGLIRSSGEQDIWNNVPLMYKILSHSPLPSFIDQFNSQWLRYTPFLNKYTPYNAVSELWALSPLWLYAFFSLHALFFRLVLSLVTKVHGYANALQYLVVAICAATMFQALQYPLRTFVKYSVVGLVLIGIIALLVRFTAGKYRRTT
jgi:hypothetical protein